MEKNTLVTITRQYGSGGREVADLVAKKMGVRRYDRKVVAMAAEKLGDEANFHRMYIEQAKVILEVAKEDGSAVFLGRCADYILKDQPNTYSFFIYADDDYRLARAKTHYAGHTIKELDAEDKHREQYYAYYTGRTWGDPQNYDLMINTSKISLEAAADLIISYIELRQKKTAEA